jgi:hypothetical protein
MTFLAVLLILIALALYGLKEYYQIKTGISMQKTPAGSMAYIAQLIERSAESGTFLDLSSGYGGRVLELAKRLPTWEITGVEQSPTPWIVANLRTIGKNYGNYRFFMNDTTLWPLKDYSVVFIHQEAKTIRRWESSIAKRLQPGTLFISYNQPLPRIKAIDTVALNPTTTLYLYKKPAVAEDVQPLPIEGAAPITPVAAPVVETHPEAQPEISLPS